MQMQKKLNVRQMTYAALSAALIAVCSWVTIPAAVPFTLQTFAVFTVCSLVLGRTVAFMRGGEEGRALAVGIGRDGQLLVRRADGSEEALNAGEVRILPAGRNDHSTFW